MSFIGFPVQPPARPPGYLARQGYVKPLWQIMLRRSDVNPHRTYVPDDEAYNLPALKEKLESDKYSISTIDRVTVELTRTDELVGFLKRLKGPKFLRIKIFSYLLFRKHQKQLVWFGQLQNLPEGVDAYPWDKLKLTFSSPPGAWEDGDGVKDPDTKSAYRNKHVTDVLLPAFLKKARTQSKGGTHEWKLEAPEARGDNYFWSGLDRPRKRLAEEVPYDDTCRVTAMCWNSKKGLLYLGVHDGPGSGKFPWLISYNPSTRKWAKVTKFKYGGGRSFLWKRNNTEWEVEHLEYSEDDDKVYFVCRTNHLNLSDNKAHYKCKGEIDMAAPVPRVVTLTDDNLFTLHDKGVRIQSRCVAFDNRTYTGSGRSREGVDYYADMITECVGWGTPQRGVKECGPPMISGRVASEICGGIDRDTDKFRIPRNSVRPGLNHYVEIEVPLYGWRQAFGMVTNVNDDYPGHYIVTVAIKAYRDYPRYVTLGSYKFYTHVYFHPYCNIPEDNVFIPEPQNVGLEFLTTVAGFDPETVYAESCLEPSGREQFFWPRSLGEAAETEEFFIDEVGYTSFISVRDLNNYDSGEGYEKYISGPVPIFKISLNGYNPAYLIADKFWVRSELQNHYKTRVGVNQPGECELLYDGGVCTYYNGTPLATYGNIFLWKAGSKVYAAWNDFEEDENGEQHAVCRVAEHSGNGKFAKLWQNRSSPRWYDKPESYLTSFAFHNGRFYFGCRYYERNWIPTEMKIFWAAPPQGAAQPTGYDGGYAVLCMVKGDKSDVIEKGDMISFGAGKYYRVTEIETLEREVVDGGNPYLAPGEGTYRGKVTSFVLLSLDTFAGGEKGYEVQIAEEVLGKEIYIAKGRVERHQIKELANWGGEGADWKTVYTATAEAGEPAEGKEVEYDAKQWKGEAHTIEYDEDYPRMPRIKLKNNNVVGDSITVTLKGSAREIGLEDKTSKPGALWFYSIPIPTAYDAYVHRKQGDDYNSCYIYFNPILEGEEIDVTYTYYVSDAAIKSPVVFKGDLYFNETGDRHRFLRVYREDGETTVANTCSPRAGDRELSCITAGDDRIWAISAPSYLLVQFAKEWSGYVHEADGAGKKIWKVVTDLARAGDQYCFDRRGTLYVVNRATPTKTGTFPNTLKITLKDLPPYERVVFSYANGKVARGTGKPELSLSCNYVYDKGHAEILCGKAYEYYTVRRREYHVECAGILEQIGLGEEKEFEYLGKQASGIIVGRQFSPKGTTTFTVVEKAVLAEGSGGQGTGQEA